MAQLAIRSGSLTLAIDTDTPESIMMASQEEVVPEPTYDTSVFYGNDVVQPRSRDDAFPAAHGSRRPITDMNRCKVEPLDPMWRTFMALARHDEWKERRARRAVYTRS